MRIIFVILAAVLSATTASAASITWTFSGAPYDGSLPDLGGRVIVTLDDEGTAGSVKIRIDASDLPNTDSYIRHLYLNTTFDSDLQAIFETDVAGTAAGSFESRTSNEDGLAAGTGGFFDFRLAFFENVTDYFKGGEVFEATLNQNAAGLLASSFLDVSVGGTAGAFEMALLLRSPDDIQVPAENRTNDYFAGVIPEPSTALLLGLGLAGLGARRRVIGRS